MTYELPRTESGEVDWYELADYAKWKSEYDSEIVAALKAIDANARKEERERIVKELRFDFGEIPLQVLRADAQVTASQAYDAGSKEMFNYCLNIVIRALGDE